MHRVEFVIDGETKVSFDMPDDGGKVIEFDRAGFIECTADGNFIFNTSPPPKIELK